VDYADPYTKGKLQKGQESGAVIIPASSLHDMGNVIDALVGEAGLTLTLAQIRMVKLDDLQV